MRPCRWQAMARAGRAGILGAALATALALTAALPLQAANANDTAAQVSQLRGRLSTLSATLETEAAARALPLDALLEKK